MRRTFCGGVLTLLLAPAIAAAGPSSGWRDDTRIDVTDRMIDDGPFYTCSTGDAGSLLVGAAALGMMLRRRR